MAHEHSVTIHNYLSLKIAEAQKKKDQANQLDDSENVQFHSGQLEELVGIRKYLTDKIDLNTQKYYK
jgi:hypothetical protein